MGFKGTQEDLFSGAGFVFDLPQHSSTPHPTRKKRSYGPYSRRIQKRPAGHGIRSLVRTYIEQHPDEPISADTVVTLFGCDRRHACNTLSELKREGYLSEPETVYWFRRERL